MSITLERLDVTTHAGLLHTWVTHPRSAFWMMGEATPAEVAHEYGLIDQSPHHDAWLGRVDGVPAFLAETYDPAQATEVGLVGTPELRRGDLGMHVLVAPTDTPVAGFTRRVFGAVMAHCFAEPDVRRVVVEPDVGNEAIARMNKRAGFVVERTVDLPGKTAALSFCTREAFEESELAPAPVAGTASDPAAHLSPELLATAQRHLVAKAIAEFSHERLLEPTPLAPASTRWRLMTPDGRAEYTFTAERLALDHWALDESTLARTVDSEPADLDVQAFVVEVAPLLGLPDSLLPTYLEELASTLAGAVWKLHHHTASAADLVDADYQTVEAAMTEGHPSFVANNGRIGYGLDDYAAYAPETGSRLRLVWVAARREHTRLSVAHDLTEEALYAGELDAATRTAFTARLADLGLDPADYLYLPLHPWQWTNKVAITFAPDLARRDLVWLGEGPDEYRAQQSIRTFFNVSDSKRHYVKTALSIQNMGFMRGLSPAYMGATPAINDWVATLVHDDPTLAGCGFSVLRERAAIGYTGDAYHELGRTHDVRSPYTKMLAALWRESPVPRLGRGESLATMASLLHRDADGASLAAALIEASPLDATSWLRSYLHAYVRPIAHCLLAHDLAFMPHGENLVLVMRDHVPVRVLMKDVGEEVAVMGDQPLPAEVERIRVEVTDDLKALALHTDVFDGVLRHLAAILHTDGVLDQAVFWAEVGDCLRRHGREHPELAAAAARYDLFRDTFDHSCLNRLQLRNTLEMVDLTDQAESLLYGGTLDNPIAPR